jgi:tripartite-type tricarboxylate transporter receptor subunit TctC
MKKSVTYRMILSVIGFLLMWSQGFSASYPDKPINLIVPWGAGGNADVQARLLAEASKEFLKQPIIVTNKPGGATIPGLVESLQAPPDGYTLIWIALPSVATQPYLKKTPFSYNDFTPIVNVSENSMLLYVPKDSPWQTLDQFLNHAKSNPVNVSCNGIGALPHLAGAELAMKSGAKMRQLAMNCRRSRMASRSGHWLSLKKRDSRVYQIYQPPKSKDTMWWAMFEMAWP